MLLRNSSAPILNSFPHHSRDSSSPDPEFQFLQKTNSFSFHSVSSIDDYASKKVVNCSHVRPHPHCSCGKQRKNEIIAEKKEEEAKPSSRIQRLFSSSGLGDIAENHEEEIYALETSAAGGGIGGGCGGGGKRSDDDVGNDGSEFYSRADAYFEKMISADPGNSLILGNYAKFLKDVRRDFAKAKEYYGRAILANPNDGNILSLYADLIWEKDKDSQRAETYFDQAVKTAPDDSYVLASYARFLWDTEEEEVIENRVSRNEANAPPPRFFSGHPLTAAT